MKKPFKLIFNKSIIVASTIILQIVILLTIVIGFYEYYLAFQVVSLVLSFLILLAVINRRGVPEFKLPWIILLCLFPLLGVVLYLLFSENAIRKKFTKRAETSAKQFFQSGQKIRECYTDEERAFNEGGLAKYLVSVDSLSAYGGTQTQYFAFGEEMYSALLEDLRAAKRFIFLEYFIIERGKMWDSILEILQQKAKDGVEIRVLYDDIGCSSHLKSRYYKTLRKYGIQCYKVNPFIPVISGIHNNRDHRKITVIDGQIGYTGGINLADEYINHTHPFGKWKDTAVRLEGVAVNNLTLLFLGMYNMMSGKTEAYEPYLIAERVDGADCMVQPFGDGPKPLYNDLIAENTFLHLIEKAQESIYITTPYLIIDYALQRALCFAAKRGVDVRIITPGIPDKKIVFAVTRSNYRPLLDAGVKIYEYSPGFIHSKVVVCDGEVAFCGTVNMDYRSLVHHFECGVMLYGGETVKEMQRDFLTTVQESREVARNFRQNPIVGFFCGVLMVFTPLL